MNIIMHSSISIPLAEGHTLVIPKRETDYIFDIEDEEYKGLFLFAKKVAAAMLKVIPCERIGIAVIGLEVSHAHIHLVPLKTIYDIDFRKPKLKLSPEKFTADCRKDQWSNEKIKLQESYFTESDVS